MSKRKLSEEHIENIRKAAKDPKRCKKISESLKGRPHPYMIGDKNVAKRPEIRKKISMGLKGRPSSIKDKSWDEFYGEERAKEIRKKLSKSKVGVSNPKCSETRKRLFREGKLIVNFKGEHHTKKSKIKQSETRKRRLKEGKIKVWTEGLTKETDERLKRKSEMMLGNKNNAKRPEVRKKISIKATKRWQDPEYVKKLFKSLNIKPNNPEIQLNELIHKVTKDFKYNGDFSEGIMIGGKIPDFVNCNGKKQVIEMFGIAFHDPDKAFVKVDKKRTYQGTMEHYKKFGWDCLIVWDYELKELDKVINKIKEFVNI